jgi:hypothetical protein
LYADKKTVETAFDKMTRAYVCQTCGESFSLLESMGALTCKQHPGVVQKDGTWSCCGKPQFPARWSKNWEVQRMFNDKNHPMPYNMIPSRTGCQACDHNTSDAIFTHKDAMPIADLSALLPFLNKEFPFHLRKGFDNGILRRCAKRRIRVPNLATNVKYMDNSGEIQEFEPENGTSIPEGMEISAKNIHGQELLIE